MSIITIKGPIQNVGGLGQTKMIIAKVLIALGQAHRLDLNTAKSYVETQLEQEKYSVTPTEYIMAQEGARRRSEQVGSYDFLNHPASTSIDFVASKTNSIAEINDENIELFKKFMTLYIVQKIRETHKMPSQYAKVVNIKGDYNLPTIVVKAAKNSNINPQSIHVYKSGIRIDLKEKKASYTTGYQQPRTEFHIPDPGGDKRENQGKNSFNYRIATPDTESNNQS